MFKVGDNVVVLREYLLAPGKITKINKKSISVKIDYYYCIGGAEGSVVVHQDKVALRTESLVLVYQLWEGRNSYRLERELYKEYHKPAFLCNTSNYVVEKSYGVINTIYTK